MLEILIYFSFAIICYDPHISLYVAIHKSWYYLVHIIAFVNLLKIDVDKQFKQICFMFISQICYT